MKLPILFAAAAGLLLFSTPAHAAVYASSEDACKRLGYDKGVLQTAGTWKGKYLCKCESIVREIPLENQVRAMERSGRVPEGVYYEPTATRPQQPRHR